MPRLGFCVTRDKSAATIQRLVDASPPAEVYCSDGYAAYADVVYPGRLLQNYRDKSDTHDVESINADLRCFIAGLQRKSRCFYRKIEALADAVELFAEAYNAYGLWKSKCRRPVTHCLGNEGKHLHHWNYRGASIYDFVSL